MSPFFRISNCGWLAACAFALLLYSCHGQQNQHPAIRFISEQDVLVGAQQTKEYFPLLQGKNVGLVANQTSTIGRVHLADSLVAAGMNMIKIFGPEHGFRGDNEAGKEIRDGIDIKTGVRVISLYGSHKKPTREDLQGVEIMIYDIQDVGVRFYTYISTMTLVMEACAENDIPLIILDRPNPNGFYVDGPVLERDFASFVGMHPVPLVYGLTSGEYALMANEEGWLSNGVKCNLQILPVKGYDHSSLYQLPVKPSPNLPDWQSVYLYPSLGLFEGTFISVGRGTDSPFRILGHPDFMPGSYVFTPKSIPGVSDHPPYEGEHCYGQNVSGFAENFLENDRHFTLAYLIGTYEYFKDSSNYFNNYFEKLAGTADLRSQVMNGLDEEDIRKSWEQDIKAFMKIRKKYLLYPDFRIQED